MDNLGAEFRVHLYPQHPMQSARDEASTNNFASILEYQHPFHLQSTKLWIIEASHQPLGFTECN